MKKPVLVLAAALAALGLGGCAMLSAPSVAPGTSAADVQARLGKPSDIRTVRGNPAWDYVLGPEGFQTYRVNLDGGNRVSSIEPLLSEQRFTQLKPGVGREEIASMFGRPLQVSNFPRLGTEVWTYRFKELTMEMLADVYVATRDGKVQYTAIYRDPAYSNSFSN